MQSFQSHPKWRTEKKKVRKSEDVLATMCYKVEGKYGERRNMICSYIKILTIGSDI